MTQTIRDLYGEESARRQVSLSNWRRYAAKTLPRVLPATSLGLTQSQQTATHTEANRPEQCYQNIGSNGISNLAGLIAANAVPAGAPWILYPIQPEFEPLLDPASRQRALTELTVRQQTVQNAIESAPVMGGSRRRGFNDSYRGFFPVARSVFEQVLVTGDYLVHMDGALRLRLFTNDQYVALRDGRGEVVYWITNEAVDPLNRRSLSEEQFEKSGLKRSDLESKSPRERMQDLYTKVEWEPSEGGMGQWRISQEINGSVVHEFTESVPSYFGGTFTWTSGESYGRGFVEQNFATLVSLDELEKSVLRIADISSRIHPLIDPSSGTRPEDFTKPSGEAWYTRVEGGQPTGIAFLQPNKSTDGAVIANVLSDRREMASRTMQLGSGSVRQSERTTAFEIERTILTELQSTLGGMLGPVVDQFVRPLVLRAEEVLVKNKKLAEREGDLVGIEFVTGLAGFARAQRALSFRDAIADTNNLLGDRGAEIIDAVIAAREIFRVHGADIPGLVLTDEQIQARQQQAAEQQAAMTATEQTIRSAGRIAEQG